MREANCFGISRRLSGQRRVPKPPQRMIGVSVGLLKFWQATAVRVTRHVSRHATSGPLQAPLRDRGDLITRSGDRDV